MFPSISGYTFRDNSSLVPLQTELNQVQNYYKLQKLNTRDSSELTISADPAVSKFPVPMLCIQTFVENSFKHGRISSQPLNVHISVQLTETEEGNYLNISIQDNGTGFPDEFSAVLSATYRRCSNRTAHRYTQSPSTTYLTLR